MGAALLDRERRQDSFEVKVVDAQLTVAGSLRHWALACQRCHTS